MYSLKLSDVLHNLSNSSNLTANTNTDRRRRKQLAFYLRNYHLIIAAFVTIILLLSTWNQLGIRPFHFPSALLDICLYPLYIEGEEVAIWRPSQSHYSDNTNFSISFIVGRHSYIAGNLILANGLSFRNYRRKSLVILSFSCLRCRSS